MAYSAFGVEHGGEISKGLRTDYAVGRALGSMKSAANAAGEGRLGREAARAMRNEAASGGVNRAAMHVGEHSGKYAAGAGAAGGATVMHLRDKRKLKKK